MSEAILARWGAYCEQMYGTALPEDYLAFDLETTGFHRNWDLPVEFGYTIVRGRKPVNHGGFVLNWADHPSVDEKWLRSKLESVHHDMAKQGKPYRFTVELLRKEGKPPEQVLRFVHKLFTTNREFGAPFVAHNGWSFDVPVICNIMKEFTGLRFMFEPNELFDTGGMEKASQLGMLPKKDESMQSYFARVSGTFAKGVKWSIDHCIKVYKLREKYGVDPTKAHGAPFDSYVCHLLLEEHRHG